MRKLLLASVIALLAGQTAAQQIGIAQVSLNGGKAAGVSPSTLLTGLLSYYTLDEGSGATRVDVKGGNDLSDNGTVGSVAGVLGNAASFTSTSYLSAAYNSSFEGGIAGGTGASWSMWLRRSATPASSGSAQLYGASSSGKNLQIGILGAASGANVGKTSTTHRDTNSSQPNLTGSTNICDDAWHHVVVTYNASDLKHRVYLDGSLSATSTAGTATNLFNLNATLYVGKGATATVYAVGNPTRALIDELANYDKTLSSTEITCLFGGGTPPAYPFTGVCN